MNIQSSYQQPNFQTPDYSINQISYQTVQSGNESTELIESAEKTNTATQDLFCFKIPESCLPVYDFFNDNKGCSGFGAGLGCGIGSSLFSLVPGAAMWAHGSAIAGPILVGIGSGALCLLPCTGFALARNNGEIGRRICRL